ncbi:MAG: transporter, substrate-binding protein aliphatic sulfonates family [Chloroflexi bacterium]|jgi:NitT/TauT family transport system substrate-binding protein|nr:transporter, substrate-binding protein aliphatic sulfonates family [Chloroflexota bacterium]
MNPHKKYFGPSRLLSQVILSLVAAALVFAACGDTTATPAATGSPAAATGAPVRSTGLTGTVRLGFLPNLTHPQALFGIGNGLFSAALGKGVKLEIKPFNAGPASIEALLAGEIDLTYIGPNPAINAYVKTKGDAVRVIAGATSGGVSFIVRSDIKFDSAKDLDGKKFATPQLGNTQDVALRNYIKQNGFETKENGGTVEVVPTENANILQLFQNKQIDGAWVPEPWATRLIVEQKGKLFLDESSLWPDGKFVITHILASTKFLNGKPELVRAFLGAHVQATQDIQKDPAAARKVINEQLKALTGKGLSDEVLASSFKKLQITLDPLKPSLLKSADSAFALGFLGKQKPVFDNLYDLRILNEVLQEKGLPTIRQ